MDANKSGVDRTKGFICIHLVCNICFPELYVFVEFRYIFIYERCFVCKEKESVISSSSDKRPYRSTESSLLRLILRALVRRRPGVALVIIIAAKKEVR